MKECKIKVLVVDDEVGNTAGINAYLRHCAAARLKPSGAYYGASCASCDVVS